MYDDSDERPNAIYTIDESPTKLVVKIVAPSADPEKVSMCLNKHVLIFTSYPYFLRIPLPHPITARSGDQRYDPSTGTYKVILYKYFDDYDPNDINGTFEGDKVDPLNLNNAQRVYYGFANRFSNMFGTHNKFSAAINLPYPDYCFPTDRKRLRALEEYEKWNDEHYLADLMETDHLEPIFNYIPPWQENPVNESFTDEEMMILCEASEKALENDDLTEREKTLVEFQLVDILFGYCYNKRTTVGYDTVESGWVINKLSSTLSWLEEFDSMKDVLTSCYKRSLIYPLYRNWKLCRMLHNDIIDILKCGPKQVTRCFIEMIDIFKQSENRYILNILFVNDICHYSSCVAPERLENLAEEVQRVRIAKCEVNSELPLLEVAAYLTVNEDPEEHPEPANFYRVMDKMIQLKIDPSDIYDPSPEPVQTRSLYKDLKFHTKPSDKDVKNQTEPLHKDVQGQTKPSDNDVKGQTKPSDNDVKGQTKPSQKKVNCQTKPSDKAVGGQTKP